ncbi:hypothetical protein [Ruminococcus sp.]|uniref:hypothetical protein n=1 Tax=Ruminococcus sp. TaxID=41978 RepID=UPI001B474465|nr:hypothetical protein [Ruminococcus sp.]MBP5434173.1 hypothetical protein [Ruminococcus sp.]
MKIYLYRTAADNRKIDKLTGATALTGETGITIQNTDRIDLLTPVFEIAVDATYMTANYLYCDTYDRYYYINTNRINTAQRLELICEVDVRQSFSAALRATECTIIRAESIAQPTKIIDSKLPVNPTSKIVTSIVLPETSQSFDTNAEYSYLLTVVGGEPSA